MQEIVDLNAGSLLIDHNDNLPWEAEIAKALQTAYPRAQYEQIVSRHLVGILLAVYVKRPHAARVKDVLVDTVGVGIMGVGVRARA